MGSIGNLIVGQVTSVIILYILLLIIGFIANWIGNYLYKRVCAKKGLII